ncbi:hypothetical protein BTUL_0462g00030 [Botrytis tulipae]|uniref:chitinase n=1 Tax=Botrytis tulipae TaxID=87230 RepID=A0A4Z1EBW5_9HELO|nr:hypothetical protein BTUL_0462g00030 [Botrytis tulipae]
MIAFALRNSTTKYRNAVYFVNWAIYERQYFPRDLPVAGLTHILYAFANIDPDTGVVYLSDVWADTSAPLLGNLSQGSGSNLFGCFQQLYILKKQNRNLKVLLSIGGATYSSNFAAATSTFSQRAMFASSAVSLVQNLGLDGIDIDWEYPSDNNELNNLVLLLQETRDAFDKIGNSYEKPYHFLITIACSANPSIYDTWSLSEMDQYIDFWNLMAFDYSGSWSITTAHQANLYPSTNISTPFDTQTAISYYLAHGISGAKIVLGIPVYGRSFDQTNGLGQTFQGVGQGTWQTGIYDYKELPISGATETYDAKLGASHSWDDSKKELISYDNPSVVIQKAEWVQSMNLGGVMWWESSADGQGCRSLIWSVTNVFGDNLQNVTNQLSFPNSTYVNIRNGMPGLFNISSPYTMITSACSEGGTPVETSSAVSLRTSSTISKGTTSLFNSTIHSTAFVETTPSEVSSYTSTTISSISSLESSAAMETYLSNTLCTKSSVTGTLPTPSVQSTAFSNTSSAGTTALSSPYASVTNGNCAFPRNCSLVTTTFAYLSPTVLGSGISWSPQATDTALICACENKCLLGVTYGISGTSATTLCGNTMPAGFTKLVVSKTTLPTSTGTVSTLEITVVATTTIPAARQSSGCNTNLPCYPNSVSVIGALPTGLRCVTDMNNDPICVGQMICANARTCTTNDDCAQGEACILDGCWKDACATRHCGRVATGCPC